MYRPVSQGPQAAAAAGGGVSPQLFFGDRNTQTLYTVLEQDMEQRRPLDDGQKARLEKTLGHYLREVYQTHKDSVKPLSELNREVLLACSKDFTQYLQRKDATRGKPVVKQVMDDGLFQETSQRFERMAQERQEVKALPPPAPDFRISLTEDGPPAAELFERAKQQREREALRSAQTAQQAQATQQAQTGLQRRIQADTDFRSQQDAQNRQSESMALVQRNPSMPVMGQGADTSLVVLPDRRELMNVPVGSFDGMTAGTLALPPRSLGQSSANPTLAQPLVSTVDSGRTLPQEVVVREDKIVSYREVENNLFIYSADRDWLRNNKENRYQFTVQFDPAANGQSFGVHLAAQHKFKNIVRIELVKAILPGENVDVTVYRTRGSATTNTAYQNNILNLPYVTVRVAELENNNYGTDNFLDRSFGVLQYDAQWLSDTTTQSGCSKGFLAMIPKHLKCQKEYYPTPLSTLQKMTIELCRPNGQPISASPDTFDVGGIIAPQTGEVMGVSFPFTNTIKYADTPLTYNVMIPMTNGSPANFYINTTKYFSKFEMCAGDRIQISGYSYSEDALNDPTHGPSLRAFCRWINRPEGHIVLDAAYSVGLSLSDNTTNLRNGFNDVGYANFLVIQARYQDPSTGSVLLDPFSPSNFGAALNAFGISLVSPIRLINLNKQTTLVFRVITREMDSLPQLRPDNNY